MSVVVVFVDLLVGRDQAREQEAAAGCFTHSLVINNCCCDLLLLLLLLARWKGSAKSRNHLQRMTVVCNECTCLSKVAGLTELTASKQMQAAAWQPNAAAAAAGSPTTNDEI